MAERLNFQVEEHPVELGVATTEIRRPSIAFADLPPQIRMHRVLLDAVGSQFEFADPGTTRRQFYEDLMRGFPLVEALQRHPNLDLGSNPDKTLAILKGYVDERRLYMGRIASGIYLPRVVAVNRAMVINIRTPEAIRESSDKLGSAIFESQLFNAQQNQAVACERARVNQGLLVLGSQLDQLEKDGKRDTPEYRVASTQYANLRNLVVEVGVARLAVQKSAAKDGLDDAWNELEAKGGRMNPEEAKHAQALLGNGLVGAIRIAHGTRFAGWVRNEDVLLQPAHEARIALTADPLHNQDYLSARAASTEHRSYTAVIQAAHVAELDKRLAGPPAYDEHKTLGGTLASGTLVQVTRSADGVFTDNVIEAKIVGNEDSQRTNEALPPGKGRGTLPPGNSVPKPDPKGISPIVMTQDHLDATIADAELKRQEASIRNRQLVHLAFGAGSAGLQVIQIGSKLAANPDAGLAPAFLESSQLALMTTHQAVLGYQQQQDNLERITLQEIERRKNDQRTLADGFKGAALGTTHQLQAMGGDPRVVQALHGAEMETRHIHKDQLEMAWKDYQQRNSSDLYREIFAQAANSQSSDIRDFAQGGLGKVDEKVSKGQSFTAQDFDALLNSSFGQKIFRGEWRGLRESMKETDGFARLESVSLESSTKSRATLRSLENVFMVGTRKHFEQETIWSDPNFRNDYLKSFMSQPGVQVVHGANNDKAFQLGNAFLTQEQVGGFLRQKWTLERELIARNVQLADADPLLADALRRHHLDAACVLEGVYASGPTMNRRSTEIAQAIRQMGTMEPTERVRQWGKGSQDPIPQAWNVVGEEKFVGLADVGHGLRVAHLNGYLPDGTFRDGRLLIFQEDTHGRSTMIGAIEVDKRCYTAGGLEKQIRDQMKKAYGRQRGICEEEAQAAVEQDFRFLRDPRIMRQLAQGLDMASVREGLVQLARSPRAFSIFDYPRGPHLTAPNVERRFDLELGPAVGEAGVDVHRGLRERQDLSGIFRTFDRLDSWRNNHASRRDLNSLNNAFNTPTVREDSKGRLYDEVWRD